MHEYLQTETCNHDNIVSCILKSFIFLQKRLLFRSHFLLFMTQRSNTQLTRSENHFSFLPVYYQSNEWAGVYGMRERDYAAWAAKQDWWCLSVLKFPPTHGGCYFFLFLLPNVLPPALARPNVFFLLNMVFFLRSVFTSRPWIQSSRWASHFNCFRPVGTSGSDWALLFKCIVFFNDEDFYLITQQSFTGSWVKLEYSLFIYINELTVVQPICFSVKNLLNLAGIQRTD